MCRYHVGDRVRCIKSYQNGVRPGESGTVVGYDYVLIQVRWDEYSGTKHTCNGKCDRGHGWNVPHDYIVPERCESDFGVLPVLDVTELW